MLCTRVHFVLPEVNINKGNSFTPKNQSTKEKKIYTAIQDVDSQQVGIASFAFAPI